MKHFIRNNFYALCLAFIPAGLFLGPLPFVTAEYYGLLISGAIYTLLKVNWVNWLPVSFFLVCALSIFAGNPDPVFNSWMRWALFGLLLLTVFPVFDSHILFQQRYTAAKYMLAILTFTSVGSFFAYFMGINYMTKAFVSYGVTSIDAIGWFGGLTYQSMTLGPICAITLTLMTWILLTKNLSRKYSIIIICFAVMSLCCMLMTASRSANIAGLTGVLSIVFLKYKNRLGKMIKILAAILLVGMIFSPIISPFANNLIKKQEANISHGSIFSSREERWQHRIDEFCENPLFGQGFSAINPKYSDEFMKSTGIVETGTSWLAILSMTGIIGFSLFLTLVITTCKKLWNLIRFRDDFRSILLLGILAVFFAHFVAEGYVFAAGGAMAYLFWLYFGTAYSYAKYFGN